MLQEKHFHLVGISGSGMRALAELLVRNNYQVSGSDLCETAALQALRNLGVICYVGHKAEQILGADHVIFSAAIAADNPEIIAAKAQGIPITHRALFLAELSKHCYTIAIAGSHGKTTISKLITAILTAAKFCPIALTGEPPHYFPGYGALQKNSYLVIEADESNPLFTYLTPKIFLLNNLDADHLSNYQNSFSALLETFINFIENLSSDTIIILNIADLAVKNIVDRIHNNNTKKNIITYSTDADIKADFTVSNIEQEGFMSHFKINTKINKNLLITAYRLPGLHNVINMLGAVIIAKQLSIADQLIQDTIQNFQGVERRFQYLGDINVNNINNKNIKIPCVVDYGHHPNELLATLKTIRQIWPKKRIVMVFQPHRYTRTRDLFPQFVTVLKQIDQLYLLPLYSAGEAVIPDINSEKLYQHLISDMDPKNSGKVKLLQFSSESLLRELEITLNSQDVIIFQGAGDVNQLAYLLIKHCQ